MGKTDLKRWGIAGALAVLAAGCAPQPEPAQIPSAATPRPSRYATATPYPTARPSDQPKPPADAADACGAASFAYLVGKNRTEIPIPVDPSLRRVACTTCPLTEEHQPRRLNILYNQDSGLIETVRCG